MIKFRLWVAKGIFVIWDWVMPDIHQVAKHYGVRVVTLDELENGLEDILKKDTLH